MVRQWQEHFYNKRYSHTCISCQPDFKKVAEAYGVKGYRVDDSADVVPVLKQALFNDDPCVIDFQVEQEENVLPIIPPGKSVYDTILAPPARRKKRGKNRSMT
jgi:acetolactate synthase-1/2/3 large subunit